MKYFVQGVLVRILDIMQIKTGHNISEKLFKKSKIYAGTYLFSEISFFYEEFFYLMFKREVVKKHFGFTMLICIRQPHICGIENWGSFKSFQRRIVRQQRKS